MCTQHHFSSRFAQAQQPQETSNSLSWQRWIRTHAPEETGALIQRLRPLSHATLWYLFHGSLRPVESPDADFANKAAV